LFQSEATHEVHQLRDLFNRHAIPPAHHGQALDLIAAAGPAIYRFDPQKIEQLKAALAVEPVKAHPSDTSEELMRKRMIVDYEAIIASSRVVFLGEHHHSETIRREVIALMPQLKELGFTHFAMEIFHSATQRHLYYPDGTYRTMRKDIVHQEMTWRDLTRANDDFRLILPEPEVYTPYFDIADAANASGLTVVGIEWCRWDGKSLEVNQEKHFHKMGLTQEFLRLIEHEGERYGMAASTERYAHIYHHHVPVRNWHGATVLAKVFEDPAARVAVLGGMKHYGHMIDIRNNFTLNRLLEQHTQTHAHGPVRGRVVYYAAHKEPTTSLPYRKSPSITEKIFRAAEDAHLSEQRFMLCMEQSDEMDTPDVVVHVSS
jgi:hypothetical protein